MSNVTSRVTRAGALRLAVGALLVALGFVWPRGAGADEPPGPAPGGGVVWVDAWTNDDGVVDDAVVDAGDVGDVSAVYDAHGTASSDDPTEPGFNPAREDKDVAICTIEIIGGSSDTASATVGNAYPGYVCTLMATLSNDTGVPADIAGAVVESDDGLVVGQVGALPDTLGVAEQAAGVFFVQVAQSAPEDAVLGFTITLGSSGDHGTECVPLTAEDLPSESDVLIEEKSMCVYFFDAKEKECGPGWTEENPFAWQFRVKNTGGDSTGVLTAFFVAAGELTTSDAVDVMDKEHLYYLYTPTADTLIGAYLSGIPGADLKLEGTCNDPDLGGHVLVADLTLQAATTGNGGGTATVAFTLTNEGDGDATDIVVWARLGSGVRIVQSSLDTDRKWHVPALRSGETVATSITVELADAGSHVVAAEVVSALGGDRDSIPGNGLYGEDDMAVTLADAPPSSTQDSMALAFTLVALVAAGVFLIIRRRRTASR